MVFPVGWLLESNQCTFWIRELCEGRRRDGLLASIDLATEKPDGGRLFESTLEAILAGKAASGRG
jgi:hypothetical protein